MIWDWNYTIEIFPTLFNAMWIALAATVVAYSISLVFGLVVTLAGRSNFKPLTWLTFGFVSFIRSTPPLVQLFFAYFALPQLGISLSAFVTGVIVLGIHYSTYVSEIYRSGIESIPKGQWEASRAMNFSKAYTWRKIILPQAIPPVIPMLGNYLIVMFKETPMLSAITVVELLQTAKIIGSENFSYLEPITIVGALFLLLSYCSAILIRKLENRMKYAHGNKKPIKNKNDSVVANIVSALKYATGNQRTERV